MTVVAGPKYVAATHAGSDPTPAISEAALDLLAGDPPRYPHIPGDFRRHPETGAPYVNHPTETKADGTPKRVMYGRPSSFGSALDNPFNLVKWKERQLLIGVDSLLCADDRFEFPDPDDHDYREALDGLAARCHDAAGSHLAADQGTHIHRITERVDRGQAWHDLLAEGVALGIPEVLQKRIVASWLIFRKQLGIKALAVEQTVVNDRWRLAGTLDRLDVTDHDILTAYGVLEAGVPFVGDIKTGGLTLGTDGQPNYWVKYPVQLAAYVDGVPYDTETDERGEWVHYDGLENAWVCGERRVELDHVGWESNKLRGPHQKIALIYHYDLARALAGEVVDWQAIPVNVDAGREGGDLCRAAADFAKRRDLFAMPAPKNDVPADPIPGGSQSEIGEPYKSAVPAPPTVVEQQAADPEPSTASTAAPGPAVTPLNEQRFWMAWDRACLKARIKDLVDQGHEPLIRQWWPEGVPTLKHDGHTDAQLQLILACVRRVEAEVGAGWHPDDGPPPHVNTNPRAVIQYPTSGSWSDEGGRTSDRNLDELTSAFFKLTEVEQELCHQIAQEANAAGRIISLSVFPTVRRWSIARAVIAWAASGRTVDELWFAASNLATFEQCRDPSATLGGLISQFTIEQADRLYEAAGQ